MEHRQTATGPHKKSGKEAAGKGVAAASAYEDGGDEEDGEVTPPGGAGPEEDKKRRSMPSSSAPAGGSKRGAGSGSGGAAGPCCQAEKCAADLTEAKRYYRRHKVCEAHSKAAAVVVAGLRQRFCQQCSRFHELSEFDDSKRSCRRRLAGHNERRRKSSSEGNPDGRIQISESGNPTRSHNLQR